MHTQAVDAGPERYIGHVLGGRYRVESLLGTGGMGSVYMGTHTTIGGKVAIKVLSSSCSDNDELRRRFVDEAKAPNQLDHDGVIKVFDVGDTDDGSLFLAMEYLKGEDLEARLRSGGPMSWKNASAVILQLCHTLEAAHAEGIVHRDMKPANCFLVPRSDGTEQVKILDFGIAKLKRAEQTTKLTTPGSVMGTPYYMPPEQARGISVDHRADVYSVGAILYELLDGNPPFTGDSFAEVLVKVVTQPPVPPRAVMSMPKVSDDVKALLERVLAKEPDERYGSMSELADAIHRINRHFNRGPGPASASFTPPKSPDSSNVIPLHSRGSDAEALSKLSDALDRATESQGDGFGTMFVGVDAVPLDAPPPAPSLTPVPGPVPTAPPPPSASTAPPPPSPDDERLELDMNALNASKAAANPTNDQPGPNLKRLAIIGGGMAMVLAMGGYFALAGPSKPNVLNAPVAGAPNLQPELGAPPPEKLQTMTPDKIRSMGGQVREWIANPGPELLEVIVTGCKDEHTKCEAVHAIAEINYHGHFDIIPDPVSAAELYPVACVRGVQAACFDAGFVYDRGVGTPRDLDQALRHYERGCAAHQPPACVALARKYAEGGEVTRDRRRAHDLYWQACKDGDIPSCTQFAKMSAKGASGRRDPVTAAEYFERACKGDDGEACEELARMYEKGVGVEVDRGKARRLRKQACQHGRKNTCRKR